MEFVAVFLVCLLVLVILVVGLAFGRTPAYRPERQYVLHLLRGISDRTTSESAWSLFVHTPVSPDVELETFSYRCYQFDQGESDECRSRPGINGYIYDSKGREFIAKVADDLEKMIREAPLSVDF